MNRERKWSAVVLMSAIALWPVAAAQALEEQPDPASWAPADALAYIGVTDVDELWASMQGTAYFKMLKDPAAKKTGGQFNFFSIVVDKFRARLAKALETEPDELESPFGGPVAVYVTAPQDADELPGFALVAGVKNTSLMSDYFEKASSRFRKLADEFEELEFRGETIRAYQSSATTSDDDEPTADDPSVDPNDMDEEMVAQVIDTMFGEFVSGEALPARLALCLTAERLIVARTADQIKDVLRRAPQGASLADSEDYKTLLRKFKSAGPLRYVLNTQKVLATIRRIQDDDDAERISKAFGLDSIGSVIGHGAYGNDQYETRGEMLILMKGERTGLAKILSMQNRDLTPPADVSADSMIYFSLNLSIAALMDEIERIVRQIDPDAADAMRTGLSAAPTPAGPLNLRADLIDPLQGPITFTLGIADPIAADSVRFLLRFGHKNRDAFLRLIETFQPMLPLEERTIDGQTVFEFSLGGFAICPTSDALLIGEIGSVEAVLRAAGDSGLARDPSFKHAAGLVPPEAFGVLFVDMRRLWAASVELAQMRQELLTAAFGNPTAYVALGLAELFTQGIDKEKLDDAKKLAKYYAAAMLTISNTADGILITSVQLNPKPE